VESEESEETEENEESEESEEKRVVDFVEIGRAEARTFHQQVFSFDQKAIEHKVGSTRLMENLSEKRERKRERERENENSLEAM
jgi:hypothetical protein